MGDHVQLVSEVVGRDTPVEAMFLLFRFLPAVLVTSGEKAEGMITKIDLLAGT
jgi:predicted transcriptional regulator